MNNLNLAAMALWAGLSMSCSPKTSGHAFFRYGKCRKNSNKILDCRALPAGGYAWNMEDDDTKNVHLVDGKWTISQRGKTGFLQKE